MIKLLSDLPDNIIGFEFAGEVTADDYREVLDPALERATAAGHKVRAVAVLGFLGWMVPGEIKVFPATDLDAATKWASES